jgi:hypothetical protein
MRRCEDWRLKVSSRDWPDKIRRVIINLPEKSVSELGRRRSARPDWPVSNGDRTVKREIMGGIDEAMNRRQRLLARLGIMIRCGIVSTAALLAWYCGRGVSAVEQPAGSSAPIEIRLVDEAGWGDAAPADVRMVLKSVADSLLPLVPDAAPIVLDVHARGGPIALFERAPDGAIRVHLNTGGRLWSQYGYQFAHELCHVLCRFDRDDTGNRWFEEAMCEMASMFALRRMGEAWQERPPYPNWRDYATSHLAYAARLIDEAQLPRGMSFAEWYGRYRDELVARPTDRKNAAVVAAAMLPLFEDQPSWLGAIHWLNASSPPQPLAFEEYLAEWRCQVPPQRTETIDCIAVLFGVSLPDHPASR